MKTAIKKGILGKKLGMTQVFDETGLLTPVTVIEAGPCVVTQKKTIETDGYDAIQIGFTDAKLKQTNKPFRGHFEKAGLAPKKYIREFRLADVGAFDVGAELKADVFTAGELVDVTGISKGKGFQGPIKRHGQHRGPMTHGSKYHRGPGSLSTATTPGRVKKGKKLAGHMGNKRRTIQNLVIVRVDGEKNYLLIKGAVPGARGSLIIVKAR